MHQPIIVLVMFRIPPSHQTILGVWHGIPWIGERKIDGQEMNTSISTILVVQARKGRKPTNTQMYSPKNH